MIERRVKFLTDYQDAAYAQRYAALVAKVREAEARAMPGITELTEAVARYYFKLLAIKDEYEVARLYAETDFAKRVAAQFEGDYKLTFNLAPPIFNKADPVDRRAEEERVRPVDDEGVRRAGEDAQVPRHRARRVRHDRGAQERACADRRVRDDRRRAHREAIAARTTRPPSSWRRCPSTSAATATSRTRT